MPQEPKLIIHAGLPKCATSSLQNLFARNDHAVSRGLGLTWIGREMRAWGPGVPVSEFMYDQDAALERIAQMPLDPLQTYFLSSEALSGNLDIHAALANRFDISHMVQTVRMPLLMTLSAFCFSGWLTIRPADTQLFNRTAQLSIARDRLKKFAPMRLCPIEPSGLATRFCTAIAGQSPPNIEAQFGQAGAANTSISPALAATLSHMLHNRLEAPIPGAMRHNFTRVAGNQRGRDTFFQALPPVLKTLLSDEPLWRQELALYDDMLHDSDVPKKIRTEAVKKCEIKLSKLAALPVVTGDTIDALRQQGNRILTRVQNIAPETQALFKPEFRIR